MYTKLFEKGFYNAILILISIIYTLFTLCWTQWVSVYRHNIGMHYIGYFHCLLYDRDKYIYNVVQLMLFLCILNADKPCV